MFKMINQFLSTSYDIIYAYLAILYHACIEILCTCICKDHYFHFHKIELIRLVLKLKNFRQ